jgi:hypothetical protein
MSAIENLGKQFFEPQTLSDNDTARGFKEYAVGHRRGKTSMTHGRVAGWPGQSNPAWRALGVGSTAWTSEHKTRAAAIEEMYKMQGRA